MDNSSFDCASCGGEATRAVTEILTPSGVEIRLEPPEMRCEACLEALADGAAEVVSVSAGMVRVEVAEAVA